MDYAETVTSPEDPSVRYARSKTKTCHVMFVSMPKDPDPELNAILTTNTKWAMEARNLAHLQEQLQAAVNLLLDTDGRTRFDTIELVGHADNGVMAMGEDLLCNGTEGQAFFEDLQARFQPPSAVLRLLGCNVAYSPEPRKAHTDGRLFCMTAARLARTTVQGSKTGLFSGDFTENGFAHPNAPERLLTMDAEGIEVPAPPIDVEIP